jgi:hypothetical protein
VRAGNDTLSRFCISAAALLFLALAASPASAVPSFGIQTSQPCSACHTGAFGGRLKMTGRDFKLNGYATNDNKDHWVPLNVIARGSFTHTDADQKGGASEGFDVNDNFAFDGLTFSYAGKIFDKVGAVARLSYNGIKGVWQWGGADIRYADEATWFGEDLWFGVTVNNGPTRTDIWESALNGAPTAASGLSRRPKASPIGAALSGIVAGAGFYTMWNDVLYLEFDLYDGLNRDTLNAFGVDPLNGRDAFDGLIPYGRVVVQKEFAEGRHFAALGAYALQAEVFPRAIETAGSNKFLDLDIDAMYQWNENPSVSTSGVFTARVAYLRERAELEASHALSATKSVNNLSTWRADVSYSPDASWTGTVQYFSTDGTADAVRWGTPGGKIDASGWVTQIDYAPWGKPDSPVDWANLRLTAQYLAYEEFNGNKRTASDRNTFLLGVSLAVTANQ